MSNNTGTALWKGGLKDGSGEISTQSNVLNTTYKFSTRFADDPSGTNPEELVGAAYAACYTMFLASLLEKAGHIATELKSTAEVELSKDETGPFIRKIKLHTEGTVSGITPDEFQQHAEKAKTDCPISRALLAVPEMTLTATLK